LRKSELISSEAFDTAIAKFETAKAQHESDLIQVGYTEIRAPFSGLLVARYVQLAEQISVGGALFRLSDFDPLLCTIQVPEREIARLQVKQRAFIQTETWPGEQFAASVLRIRPVIESASGTVRVTLEVEGDLRLRPGMFAKVFVEVEQHQDTLVIPKAALSLESLGDSVFVVEEGIARRRGVVLGFREGDTVEVTEGLVEGEQVVSVGQDGLSEGTPVRALAAAQSLATSPESGGADNSPPMAPTGDPGSRGPAMGGGARNFDPAKMSPEQLDSMKDRMRSRGLSEKEIEEMIARRREQAGK
jgi:membrane fusion protein (multidrug efflux system)